MSWKPAVMPIVVLSIVFFVVGCSERAAEEEAETSPPVTPPSLEQLANMSYPGIYDEPVQLIDGRYEGEPFQPGGASRPTVKLVKELYVVGDLAGHGAGEAAVILAENSGGSGTQIYIAAATLRDGKPVHIGTIRVGDRTQIRDMAIAKERLIVDMVEHGPNDAACCPTHTVTNVWKIHQGGLFRIKNTMTGALSLTALAGTEWGLSQFSMDESAPAEPKLTAVFEQGKISGSAGCNRFFAGIEETAPGVVGIDQIGSTRMACADDIMKLEQRYLECIGRVNRYSFFMGTLVLHWQSDNRAGALFFTPTELPTQ